MLIIALVLAVIALAALVTAVVTSNEVIAWVCIAASVIGVVLLIVDALRERSKGGSAEADAAESHITEAEDYPEEAPAEHHEEAHEEVGEKAHEEVAEEAHEEGTASR